MERVSALDGDMPILVVVPHGANDVRTGYIAQRIHKELDAFAVINWGWQRSKITDYSKEEADCNNLFHLQPESVVGDEFLVPLMAYVDRIHMNWGRVHMFVLLGIEDHVRKKTHDNNLDLIIGYGAGNGYDKKHSYSCDINMKNAFVHHLLQRNFHAYQGASNGLYSGRDRNSLNQLYRSGYYFDSTVHSMEIRIIKELRSDDEIATITAIELADCMEEITLFDDTNELFLAPDSI